MLLEELILKELSIRKIKYLLIVAAAVLVVSNIITVYTITMYKSYKEELGEAITATKTLEENFNDKYEKLLKENEELNKTIAELEKSAEKWDIFEERYNKSRISLFY